MRAVAGVLDRARRALRRRRVAPPVENGGDPRGTFVIAFANAMFGGPIGLDRIEGPSGVRFTSDPRALADADAVVFHVPTMRRLPRRKPAGQLWVAWSLESKVNYPELAEPAVRERFDVTMTYERTSDVPLSYAIYYVGELVDLLRRPLEPVAPRELVASFISSRIDRSGRLRWQRELGRHLPLHCYGRVGRNRRLESDDWRPTKIDLLRRYDFTLAFENSIAPDYVTEKLYDPLIAGSIPVYLGAPNVEELAPGERCYVDVRDFRDAAELARYLRHLASSESERASYQAWRSRPFRESFLAQAELPRTPTPVRLAQHLLALRNRALPAAPEPA